MKIKLVLGKCTFSTQPLKKVLGVFKEIFRTIIGEKLFISISIVKSHFSNIFQKFELKNRKTLRSVLSEIIK
jgi:hypothetical protein